MGKDFSLYGFIQVVEKRSTLELLTISIGLIGILGYLDYATGYELSFSLFYLFPVSIIAWGVGLRTGLFISAVSAVVWLVSNMLAGKSYQTSLIPIWNTLIRMGFFTITTVLLNTLRQTLQAERVLSSTDQLTGALNRRAIYDVLSAKMLKSRRDPQPITLVYIDLDNFKLVNDTQGHNVGDSILTMVSQTANNCLRSSDYIGRLGGDEFMLLLPETSADIAKKVIERLVTVLLSAMQERGWPVTFSVGVLTFSQLPGNINEMIRMTDELMYQVKMNGKNSILYANSPVDET